MKRKKTKRSVSGLTTLDDFLNNEGKLEEFEAIAVKEVLVWHISNVMKVPGR